MEQTATRFLVGLGTVRNLSNEFAQTSTCQSCDGESESSEINGKWQEDMFPNAPGRDSRLSQTKPLLLIA